MRVNDADKRFLVLPVIAQLGQPVEVVGGADGLAVEFGDDVTGVYIDHNQRAESDSVVSRQRTAHQVHDVCQLTLLQQVTCETKMTD